MIPKSKGTGIYIFLGVIIYIFGLYFCGHACAAIVSGEYDMSDWLKWFQAASTHLKSYPKTVKFADVHFLAYFGIWSAIMAIAIFFVIVNEQLNARTCPGKEKGSAKWFTNMKAYNKAFTTPIGKTKNVALVKNTDNEGHTLTGFSEKNMILSNDVKMSMEDKKVGKNSNILCIGGAGTGKSRFVIKPNILQAHSSYVVTDPSGELLRDTGDFLEKAGYKIKVLNLVNFENSSSYNPFNYIRDDLGVQILVNCLMKNTSDPDAKGGDKFWDDSTRALLKALVYYLVKHRPKSEQNFASVMKLLRAAQIDEDRPNVKSPLDRIFDEVEEEFPNDIGVKEYKTFKMGAGKTLKSILISTAVRLDFFNLPEFIALTSSIPKDGNPNNLDDSNWVDDLDMATVGAEKTVLFLIISQADDTFNFLANMMYSQLFETLYYNAENVYGGRLPQQVRFLLDEFANIGQIPQFDKKLSTMRKYGMSCTIILQSLAQIKSLYKDDWGTIVSNCDSFIFLGGQEQETLKYVSEMLGKTTIKTRTTGRSRGSKGSSSINNGQDGRDLLSPDEVRTKVNKKFSVVIVNGLDPFYTRKYMYEKHPNYKFTADFNKKNTFDITSHKNNKVIESKENTESTPNVNLVASSRLALFEEIRKAKVGVEIGSYSAGFKRTPPKFVSSDIVLSQIKLKEIEDIPEFDRKLHPEKYIVGNVAEA